MSAVQIAASIQQDGATKRPGAAETSYLLQEAKEQKLPI
jgi:hypothetical protein